MKLSPLDRALSYPYHCPGHSFVIADGRTIPISEIDPENLLASRIGDGSISEHFPEWNPVAKVVACGSNRAPAQLLRKFGSKWPAPVLSVRAQLMGWDVVRSAHITSYGTIPAALIPSPGATVAISLQLLDEQSLERMHRTEAVGINYSYEAIDGIVLAGASISNCTVYRGLHGHLQLDGPQAFAEIECTGRQLPEMNQPELLRKVQQMLSPELNLESWITYAQAKREHRLQITAQLKDLR